MANISQNALAAILRRRKRIADLSAELEKLETALTDELRADAKVAPGILTAYIKEWERRSPQWKAVVERELGSEYAARVLAATRPEQHSKLVVESV